MYRIIAYLEEGKVVITAGGTTSHVRSTSNSPLEPFQAAIATCRKCYLVFCCVLLLARMALMANGRGYLHRTFWCLLYIQINNYNQKKYKMRFQVLSCLGLATLELKDIWTESGNRVWFTNIFNRPFIQPQKTQEANIK